MSRSSHRGGRVMPPTDPAVPGSGRTRREPAGRTLPEQRWPALDGLRAIAVCAVIGCHLEVLPGGYLGVDVFFVLSGFLITSLLIREWDKGGGTVRLRDFYARRVLRLLPALGCVLAAAIGLGLLLDLHGGAIDRLTASATFSAVPWVALFVSNFVFVFHPVLGWSTLGALSHAWSLAVEEQFYLLWPALFILVMRRGLARSRLALMLALLALTEMVYRALLAGAGYGEFRIYYATDTRSDGLLLGCALAFWLASGPPARLRMVTRRIGKPAMWLAAAVLLTLLVLGSLPGEPVQAAAAVLASGVLVAGIVLGETPVGLERLLCSRFALRTGRRSYGLYLWHFVFLVAGEAVAVPWTGLFPASPGKRLIFATALALAMASSFIVADLSYRFVELPALRRKRRFRGAGPA